LRPCRFGQYERRQQQKQHEVARSAGTQNQAGRISRLPPALTVPHPKNPLSLSRFCKFVHSSCASVTSKTDAQFQAGLRIQSMLLFVFTLFYLTSRMRYEDSGAIRNTVTSQDTNEIVLLTISILPNNAQLSCAKRSWEKNCGKKS
jgi:hypothetical protein